MSQQITPKQRAEIVYRFFNDVDKRMHIIADKVGVSIFTATVIITNYLKGDRKDEEIFLTFESKMNYEV